MTEKSADSIEYRFQFDTSVLRELRETINEKENLSLGKTGSSGSQKKRYSYFAWDKMCVIMDRLDDTVNYLNRMTLGKCRNMRSAFDFYEYLNCSFTVINCIKEISGIFSLDTFKSIEDSKDTFGNVLEADGTDGLFFEYARSLFSVHPVCTDRVKYPYITKTGARFHCCPFVVWVHNAPWLSHKDGRNLVATIYTSQSSDDHIILPLYIEQFYRYTDKWISYIPNIIQAIRCYNEQQCEELRWSTVKEFGEFTTEVEYLSYLRDEYGKRFGNDSEDVFNEYILFFENNLKSERNQAILEKYRNAIRYSLSFLKNSLQSMSFDGFENSGMSHPEDWIDTTLFHELSSCSVLSGALQRYDYELAKSNYLRPDIGYPHYEQMYARNLLLDIKEVLGHYVDISGEESNLELFMLARLTEYQNALNEKCLLNKNIPNEAQFRTRVLSSEEYASIFVEEEKKEDPLLVEALKELFEQP